MDKNATGVLEVRQHDSMFPAQGPWSAEPTSVWSGLLSEPRGRPGRAGPSRAERAGGKTQEKQ